MVKVLIVDDEIRMQQLIKLFLEPKGYECQTSDNGKEAIEKIKKQAFDLILLDIMMPEIDGWETTKRIREFSNIPILMLTARDQSEDMIKGLKTGADDYITKPFEEGVLLARIEAILRRTQINQKVECNGLIWDIEHREFAFNGNNITLTPIEFEMIGLLMKHPKTVFSREKLIESIWGLDSDVEDRTVDSHIRNLREKCRLAGFPINEHLKTVWGIGYKWE